MKKTIILLTSSLLLAGTIQIPVYKSVPVYKEIIIEKPYKECTIEYIETEKDINDDDSRNNIAGKIVGGAIGGIIGHQFGKGTGKTAMTILGAVTGTIIADAASSNTKNINNYETNTEKEYIKQKVCRTKYKQVKKSIQDGYINYFRVNNKTYQKKSKYPLDFVVLKY